MLHVALLSLWIFFEGILLQKINFGKWTNSRFELKDIIPQKDGRNVSIFRFLFGRL
jgi:hypothetical protein